MLEIAVEHVKRVHSVVRGRLESNQTSGPSSPHSSREPSRFVTTNRITQSWIRCLNEYKLDPGSCKDPEVVSASELQQRQEGLADVQAVAKVEMANLYQQLAGSGYAIMLTDRDGVLLNYFGDPAFTHAASKTGLMPGALWSERVQGTNGMGTCLFERRPVTVHQDEHYLSRNIGLSCAAAPIFDHEGELVGVLDASGESRLAQQHTLALVSMSVQMIENRVFLHQFRHEYILRFHNRPEFVGTLSEGAIALSVTGKVLAATRCALFQLGLPGHADIVGRDIAELFNVTFCGLIDSSVRKASHPVPIFETRSGARFFAVMYQPVTPTGVRSALRGGAAANGPMAGAAAPAGLLASAPSTARSVRPANSTDTPLDALHFGDPRLAANAETAKRVLERNVSMLLGRNRHRQGNVCPRRPPGKQPRHPPLYRDQLCLDTGIADRKRTVRLPFGRLHRRQQGRPARQAAAGERRHPVPRRDRRHAGRPAGTAAAGARRTRSHPARRRNPGQARHPADQRHPLRPAEKIGLGSFREDLYYRLQGVTITLPPLRERLDRCALIRHLALEESDEGSPVELDETLLALLDRQRWPGNVRQLRHLLRTMIALRETDCLTVHDLPEEYRAIAAAAPDMPAPQSEDEADELPDDAAQAEQKLNPLESAERAPCCRNSHGTTGT
jgi:transcriptional regulator of acetoin/glycerol metabolism